MAEDKRIRVSADASPLQELRQNAQALWNDFNKMESEFKNIAEQTVGVIQKQIDLLKERNALAGGMQGGLPNDTSTERRPTLIDPYTGRPLSGGGGAVTPGTSGRALNTQLTERQQTTLDKILSEVVRIADLMEKTQRDDTNGVLPTGSGGEPPQPPAPETPDVPTPGQGSGSGMFGKGFKMPTSMSGLMGMLPFGALIMGIGTILGQQAKYESAQYGAENEFQRRNNRGNHWLLNMLTFGISGAEAEKKEVGRNAATQNDRALGDYSALHRMSYRQALGSQFLDSFGDNVDYVTGGNTTYHDYKMATDWSYRQKQSEPKDPTKLDLSMLAFPRTEQDAKGWKKWEHGQKVQQLRNADKAGLVTDRDELPTWASRTLGLNMTDYLSQVTTLQKAGAYERNTSLHDVNQLLMAGKIRGLSEDDAASVLATTRFDRSVWNMCTPPDSTGQQSVSETKGKVQRAMRKIIRAAQTEPFIEREDDDMIICRCEEITKGEIRRAVYDGMRTTNEVKRYLRSGMGLCQGQTCQRLVQGIIASELKMRPGELGMIQGRAPVRPVEIGTFSKNVTDVKED